MGQLIKLFIIVVIGLTTTGCFKQIEYRKEEVPVLYCPTPTEIRRPELYTETLTPEDKTDPGKVVQYYDIDMVLLMSYAKELETVINKYAEASKELDKLKDTQAYKDLMKRLQEQQSSTIPTE